jgi:flagellar motor switch protein FliG
VLSYLEAEQAAEVLAALPENMRADVIMRVATLDGVHPNALNELDEVLEKQFSGNSASKASGFGGPKAAAEMMNLVGAAAEGKIFEEINKVDAPLSQQLQDLMFVFDDLVTIDDRGMQELLREIPGDKLILALKATGEELKEKFFKNMSERAAAMLKDDLEAKGPVKLSEVEAAQKEILVTARRLGEEGRVQLGGKGGDDYV